jgi:hypothetical protein
MEDSTIQKIDSYIDEFFFMERGASIDNPQEKILFIPGVWISRRSLKHIVEQRSINNGFEPDNIKALLGKAKLAISMPDVDMKNSSKEYPASRLFGKFDYEINKGVMVVVDGVGAGERCVITIFVKEARQFFKLL